MLHELVGGIDNLACDPPASGPDVLDAIDHGGVLELYAQDSLLARLGISLLTLQHEHAAAGLVGDEAR